MIERRMEGEKASLIGTSHLEQDGSFLPCEGATDAWVMVGYENWKIESTQKLKAEMCA